MENKCISAVIPCFNEGNRIYDNIAKIHAYLSGMADAFEIIAVNDGSVDNTLEELERAEKGFGIRIVNNPINEGKGSAVKDGILASRCDKVFFMDADLAIPVDELGKFLDELEKGSDVVIASRFVPGLKIVGQVLWYRRLMERGFRILRTLILNNSDIKDTQCGFKLFSRQAADKIFPLLTVKRFAFDAEVIFLAQRFGYTVKELPITLQNPIRSHVRIARDSFNMLADLIRIRLNSIRGRY